MRYELSEYEWGVIRPMLPLVLITRIRAVEGTSRGWDPVQCRVHRRGDAAIHRGRRAGRSAR